MLLMGLIASFLVYDYQLRKDGLQDKSLYYELVPFLILFGLLGASVWELIFQGSSFTISNLIQGGKTFYGGLIFCLLILIPYSKWNNIKYFDIISRLVVPLTLGHCLGRIGCFLGGCCYGEPTNYWFGVKFPVNSLPRKLHGDIALIPTQLFESLLLVILFFILLQVNNKNRHLSLYFIYYGVIRFIMEFFRFDDRGTIPFSNLSPAQLISLLLIVSGLSIHFFYKRNLNLA
jgi:phosphatidylglycerol:prolipoprotein diacylglycerol transferase